MTDFFKKFRAIKAIFKAKAADHPVPSATALNSASTNSEAYWIADFDPSLSITHEWRRETGSHGWGNAELENYTDSDRNSFFSQSSDGRHCLILKAIAENNALTSARLTSLVALGRPQGYLTARITSPSAKGIWPAFWLLPTEPFMWPTDGEIDIMESWNGEHVNHSCLHWGHYNGPDHDKHRVIDTSHTVDSVQGHDYGLAWNQMPNGDGMLVWYINSCAVMKSAIPKGIRPIADFQIKLNIAMGGNVMQGQRPDNGEYQMMIHDMGLFTEPPGGWNSFQRDSQIAPEGHGY